MKKQFLCLLSLCALNACAPISSLHVEYVEPEEWNGRIIAAHQGCRANGGRGSTPTLYVSDIPPETNLLILEIDNMDNPALDKNGGQGSIGFYHNGESTATLLPVPGETYALPKFAFEEKANRVNPSKPYPYMPPCIEKGQHYSLTVKAVNRTGSFDQQKTVLLGRGTLKMGRY